MREVSMVTRTCLTGMLAGGVLLLLGTGADAATRTVYAGPQLKRPKGLERTEPNTFYPGSVSIHQGDKVAFAFKGFHNISYAPPGIAHPALLAPDVMVTGLDDAAGRPFWFNGRPRMIFHPWIVFSQGNGIADGKGFISSGLPLTTPPPPPWTVTYPKAGTFKMYCDV